MADLLTKPAKDGCRDHERDSTALLTFRELSRSVPDRPLTRARGILLSPRRRRRVRGRGTGMGRSERRRIEPTHEWDLLVPLFEWPEQERYEEIRFLVLFDASAAERALERWKERGSRASRTDPPEDHRG